MNKDEELRLDREPDEERKSDFPLQDNIIKPDASPGKPDGVIDPNPHNIQGASRPDLETSPNYEGKAKND